MFGVDKVATACFNGFMGFRRDPPPKERKMNNEVTFPQSVAGENVTVKRANWKQHGHPATAWYWGHSATPTADKGKLARIEIHKGMVRMTDAETGAYLNTQGVAGKFWLSEATEPVVKVEHNAPGTSVSVNFKEKEAPAQEDKPSKSKKVSRLCPCGCGDMTKPGKTFIQGHDAKLSAKLFVEFGKGRITAIGAVETMAHYSEPLAAKLAVRIRKINK